ncbi:MAG: peptidoglycan-binding domain-containing protein [Candidatus Nomurabacteria bacterium]|nr:peptidoglycan-binding domain-containing protein [Candidatus Nomurabacteria bacterium]
MIKKIKISLLVVALSLSVGAISASAANPNMSWTDNANVTLGGYNYTIVANSAATSFVVNDASTIAVLVPTGSTFTLVSADKRTLGFNGSNSVATCSASANTLVVTGDSSTTVTITPTSVICGATGGLGGVYTPPSAGGGGGSYTPPAPPTPPASRVIPGCGTRTTGFSTAGAGSCVGNTGTVPETTTPPITPASSVGANAPASGASTYNFGATTLKNGSKGAAVMELQRFLNRVLNLGLAIDGKLGPKTIKVIKQWQKDNSLVADGLIGAKTKAKMNASVQ